MTFFLWSTGAQRLGEGNPLLRHLVTSGQSLIFQLELGKEIKQEWACTKTPERKDGAVR